MKCVVLAGGKGTRLRKVVHDVPKPLAPINGVPFLKILCDSLQKKGVDEFCLSVGFKREQIIQELSKTQHKISFSSEEKPLLTGGAIKKAIKWKEDTLVVNGDTYLEFNLDELLLFHRQHKANVTIACTYTSDVSRYGKIIEENGRVTKFIEKGTSGPGLINAGVYLITPSIFLEEEQEVFSFEEWLKKNVNDLSIFAFAKTSHFIDIGVPEDYFRAQSYLEGR